MLPKLLTLSVIASLAATVLGSSLVKRAEFCGQYDSQTAGAYVVSNNLWGKASATSGSQCTEVNTVSGNTLAWETSWTWEGGQYNVKSYANAGLTMSAQQVSSLSSIPFSWSWSYTGSSLVADVAFDIWLSSSSSGSYENEVMVWLAALGGAGPLGSKVSTFSSAGVTWSLYVGSNGSNNVYSYVAESTVQSLSGDILPFLQNLVDQGYFSSSQYLRAVQAGTETFTGSNAVFTTSSYTVSVS